MIFRKSGCRNPPLDRLWSGVQGIRGTSFFKDPVNRRRILLILILSAALAAVSGIKGMTDSRGLLVNDRGKLVGLHRSDAGRSENFSARLRVREKDGWSSRNVTITLRGSASEGSEKTEEQAESTEDLIQDMLKDVERSAGKTIILPVRLSDGTRISWTRKRNTDPLLFLMMPLILLAALYGSERQKAAAIRRSNADSIRYGLPSFCSQLILLLNTGMIFPDAFRRIAEGYRVSEKSEDYFRQQISAICRTSAVENKSLVTVLSAYSERIGVREFTRVVNLIRENQYRGVDLTEGLESEAEILWNQRKKLAEERGKLAETRMTLPLALLLMVLILVTAAPAVLHVEGV